MSEGRILVIDDSEIVLAKVKAVLTEAGYEVQTTTQTVGTARYLRSCDVVLVDFHMPGIDGPAVLQSLRSAAASAGSTCLFYLFTSDTERAIRYASYDFDGAIMSKGDSDALLTQVRAAMRMKKMREFARKPKSESSPADGKSSSGGHAGAEPTTAERSHARQVSSYVPEPASVERGSNRPPPLRRTGFPPPRPALDQDEEEDPTADLPRTPT